MNAKTLKARCPTTFRLPLRHCESIVSAFAVAFKAAGVNILRLRFNFRKDSSRPQVRLGNRLSQTERHHARRQARDDLARAARVRREQREHR